MLCVKMTNYRRKHNVTCLVTLDVVGIGLLSDDNFQPSFFSIAMLGNEILVNLTFLSYGGQGYRRVDEGIPLGGIYSPRKKK